MLTVEAIVLLLVLIIDSIVNATVLVRVFQFQNTTLAAGSITKRHPLYVIMMHRVKDEILKEIEKTKDKILVADKTIGEFRVKYWEHVINGFFVKNNSILLHMDIEYGYVFDYQKSWTEVEVNVSEFQENEFEPINYFWKKRVVFPDEDDCKHFYSFNVSLEYPIVCWEVRHTDGRTVMYDSGGKQIGFGVPAPSLVAFSLSGYDKDVPHDPWYEWRINADKWFRKWVNQTVSLSHPANWQISSFISDPNVRCFYEIAHSGGVPTRFQSNGHGIYYTADQLREDMKNRKPVKLAIICSCEGMRDTGSGTLSYEFRKGEMNYTATVGYVGMGSCEGWLVSLEWQDFMFKKIDRGYTIKNAFNLACMQYPTIAECVKFVGDPDLKVSTKTMDLSDVELWFKNKLRGRISTNLNRNILLPIDNNCWNKI